jgi:hypothetical protein
VYTPILAFESGSIATRGTSVAEGAMAADDPLYIFPLRGLD